MTEEYFDKAEKLEGDFEVRRLAPKSMTGLRYALGNVKVGDGVEFELAVSQDHMVLYIDSPDKRHWVINLKQVLEAGLSKVIETLPEEIKEQAMKGAQESE